MSCHRNLEKVKRAAVVAGIIGGAGIVAAGSVAVTRKLRQWREITTEKATRARQEKEEQLKAQEQLKYAQAKEMGKFYNPLTDQFAAEKYIVAGRYRLDDGTPMLDKIELFNRVEAESIAYSTGYSFWQIKVNKGNDGLVSYQLTDVATGEEFSSSSEPYGRRKTKGGIYESTRAEADEPHEIIDAQSNRVVRF